MMEAKLVVEDLRGQLRAALEGYGRRARKLSVARLAEDAELLRLVRQLAVDIPAVTAHDLASAVEQALLEAIQSLSDPVDQRIAQAVLASEPEFWDKTVAQRRAYVATNDRGFSDDQFKTRRRRVLAELADHLCEARLGATSATRTAVPALTARTTDWLQQLDHHTQNCLIMLEALDIMTRVYDHLREDRRYRYALAKVLGKGTTWLNGCFYEYICSTRLLRSVLDTVNGRANLDPFLADDWHQSGGLAIPFVDRELADLEAVHAETSHLDFDDFTKALLTQPFGKDFYSRWWRLVSKPPSVAARESHTYSDVDARQQLIANLRTVLCATRQLLGKPSEDDQKTVDDRRIVMAHLLTVAPADHFPQPNVVPEVMLDAYEAVCGERFGYWGG